MNRDNENARPWLIIFSDVWPWPVDAGHRERIHQLMLYLRNHFRLCLVSMPLIRKGGVQGLEYCDATVLDLIPGLKILPPVIRVGLLKLLRRLVLGPPPKNGAGIRQKDPLLAWLIRIAVNKYRPVAVITEYIWTLDMAREACRPSGTPIYLDTIDVFSERGKKERELGLVCERQITEEGELACWNAAEVVIAIQQAEAEFMATKLAGKEILVVPHSPGLKEPLAGQPNSGLILCVASKAQPNVDALKKFIDEQWDQVRAAVPHATLMVVGGAGESLRPLFDNKPGVVLEGIVDDLQKFYAQAEIVLNPVRYGTGLKIKSVEALAYGKCLLTTPAGAGGLPGDSLEPYALHEFELLSQGLIGLLVDAPRRDILSRNAAQFYIAHFSPDACYSGLLNHLKSLSMKRISFS